MTLVKFYFFFLGVFPYDYATSLDRLRNCQTYPTKDTFFNKLSNKVISDEDYQHGQKVFEEFQCKNMLEYLNLYMKLDTYLLADIFLTFRSVMMRQFELDPAHFISLPSYSYFCMLKYTKADIEAVGDIETFNFLASNIRGGFSFISQRLAENIETPGMLSSKLLYVDANNLYGLSQSKRLPTKDFKFLDKDQINQRFWKMLKSYDLESDDDECSGFIAEVDLEYPSELHKDHRSFPLAPEKRVIEESDLSSYQNSCHRELGTKHLKTEKLIGSFRKKIKYVAHAATLKLYTELGLKITHVHRVLTFTETKFLKPYIDFCTSKRKKALNDFEKNLYKLMCNAVFGKFIENVSRYIDMKVAKNEAEFLKMSSDPRFDGFMIVSDDITLVFFKRVSIKVKQAYAVGFSILEFAKEFMYRSYYQKIKPILGDLTKVLMSDTDSLFIATNNPTPLDDLCELLDTSNFPSSHYLFSTERKSELGYFKSETSTDKIFKFIGLRAKCYSFSTEKSEEMKCKGLAKSYRKNLGIQIFEKCINEITAVRRTQRILSSSAHKIQVIKQNKLVFSSCDDKFFLLPCGIHGIPYGSIEIESNKKECSFCHDDFCIKK